MSHLHECWLSEHDLNTFTYAVLCPRCKAQDIIVLHLFPCFWELGYSICSISEDCCICLTDAKQIYDQIVKWMRTCNRKPCMHAQGAFSGPPRCEKSIVNWYTKCILYIFRYSVICSFVLLSENESSEVFLQQSKQQERTLRVTSMFIRFLLKNVRLSNVIPCRHFGSNWTKWLPRQETRGSI